MKAIHTLGSALILVFGVCASLPTTADAALAAKNGCAACHAADKKIVGPSWHDIAAKHKGEDLAPLMAKVRAGGKGVWGVVAMPPQPKISDQDLKAVLTWAMGQ